MKNFRSHGAFQSNERLIKLFHLLNSGRTFTVVTLWTPLEPLLRMIQWFQEGITWLLPSNFYDSLFTYRLIIQMDSTFPNLMSEINISTSSDFHFNKINILCIVYQNIQAVHECCSHMFLYFFTLFLSLL